MIKKKILIDCDTGTDDAIAIVAALYADEADLIGVTTVNGNAALKYTSRNTLNLIRYLGFNNIPISKGASSPLYPHSIEYSDDTHGSMNLDCLALPESNQTLCEKNAVNLIYDSAVATGGELEIIALGPLTNIAISLILYPELKKLIKHLYIMGGAMRGGNSSTTAEFNIWVDPEAAHYTFKSGIPITMVGLDVTERAIMNEDDSKAMRALGTKAGNVVADILDSMLVNFANGGKNALMHDPLALGSALCQGCVQTRRYFVDVECNGAYTFGHTIVDVKSRYGYPANAEVAFDLNLQLFKEWLYSSICNSLK